MRRTLLLSLLFLLIFNVTTKAESGKSIIEKSSRINIDTTNGINDLKNLLGVSVAPNPASSKVNITVQNNFTVPYQIQLVNIIGEKVYEKLIDENQYSLGLDDFDSGLYFIVVFDGNEKYTQRLIISK